MTTRQAEMVGRRAALGVIGAAGAILVVGCGGTDDNPTGSAGTGGSGGAGGAGGSTTSGTGGSTSSTGSGVTECHTIPSETSGPYPDKTGMFDNPAFYRQDVTEGKPGLPLTVTFTVVNVNDGCSAIADAIVEIWHCDKDGVYSEYGGQPNVPDQTGTTFCRGLQKTDASGKATFTTIYPGWYPGRVTHIHLEVYVGGKTKKVSQMAFPDDVNTEAYNSPLYTAKGQNPTKNADDGVFADGDEYQVAELAGDTTSGYTATLVLGVAG